jgi:hypothetical protein
MKSLKSKLALSALGLVLLATPAFAQQTPRHAQQQYQDPGVTYPGLVDRSGSSTEAYTPQYVPGYGNIGATSGEW